MSAAVTVLNQAIASWSDELMHQEATLRDALQAQARANNTVERCKGSIENARMALEELDVAMGAIVEMTDGIADPVLT